MLNDITSAQPKVIKVIETLIPRGKGTIDSTYRLVRQYHTFDGVFLAENDPINDLEE